ncbi:MAG: hypothetical protein RLZZ585_740 [Bacteroidota bacterium]|jgi:hypothetical protein
MDILIYILFGGMLLFYLVYFLFRKKIKVREGVLRYVKPIHLLTFGLILVNIILYFFDLRLRGDWTQPIIMWVFLLSSFILQFHASSMKLSAVKFYFQCLFYTPLIFVLSFINPMLGAFLWYSFMLLFNSYGDKQIYEDKELNVRYKSGFLMQENEFDVYKKQGIIENNRITLFREDICFDYVQKVSENGDFLRIEFTDFDTKQKKDTLIELKN